MGYNGYSGFTVLEEWWPRFTFLRAAQFLHVLTWESEFWVQDHPVPGLLCLQGPGVRFVSPMCNRLVSRLCVRRWQVWD